MVKLAVLATVGLSLVAKALGSEISVELEQHYNGYPHTTPNTAAGATTQTALNAPQVNSFIPLVFSYIASAPIQLVTPDFSRNVTALTTAELNGDPGDIPTYLFNGQQPAVKNNYPSLFPATSGRKLLQTPGLIVGAHPGCLTAASASVTAPLVNITAATTSPSWEDYKNALCSGLNNLTNVNLARVAGRRHLLQATNKAQTLKLYGEVKKSSTTGFPMLTYVFDFTTRPILERLTKPQPTGAVPVTGSTLTFVDCVIYLPDGANVHSAPGTCFDTTPVVNGVPQPVIVRLAAKSFYYGTGYLKVTAGQSQTTPNAQFKGTQVTPIAAFAVNFKDTKGAPNKSLIFLGANGGNSQITQLYGVYADPSGIYPGQV